MLGTTVSALLHAEHAGHGGLGELLVTHMGDFGAFIDEVLLHGFLDVLILLPFLFLTYLLMEYIEHRASDRLKSAMEKSGALGPLVGASLGAMPQCAFSAAAANLYTGRVITLGTLVAVFLSTSDEMIPILIAGNIAPHKLVLIIVYKILVAVLAGFAIDGVVRLLRRGGEKMHIGDMCEDEGCHCEGGILKSALHHTVSVSLWCLGVILSINALLFFLPEDALSAIVVDIPLLSHLICALFGLIPNCAASVALSRLAVSGIISVGEMLSGLFAGAGVGLFVLFRMNKSIKENILVILLTLAVGTVFGAVADLIPWLAF